MLSYLFSSKLHSDFPIWEKFYGETSPVTVKRKETFSDDQFKYDSRGNIYIVNSIFKDIVGYGSTIIIRDEKTMLCFTWFH